MTIEAQSEASGLRSGEHHGGLSRTSDTDEQLSWVALGRSQS